MKEVLYNIGFDWQVALANLVNFLIIFFVLKKWVFAPVGKILTERQSRIQEGLEQADKAEKILDEASKSVDEQQKAARKEANALVAKAQLHADDIVNTAADKAEAKAAHILALGQEKIAQERKDMEQAFARHSASLISKGVAKVLQDDLSKEQQEALTRRALEAMK